LIKEEKMGFGLRENDLMLKMLRKESDHIFSDQKNITNSGLNFSWINENWNNLKKTNDKKIGKILWNLFVFLKWSKDNI